MNRKQLQQEHAHVKKMLAEVNDFISSEEFYKLPESKKRIHTIKKSSLETYLKTLSIELWGSDSENIDMSSLMWAGLLGAALSTPSFGSSTPSIPKPEEKE